MTQKPINAEVVASLNADRYPALKEVIVAYWNTLYAIGIKKIANGLDVEELVADTFCKLWLLKNKHFRDELAVLCWLKVVMINACNTYWRQKKNKPSTTTIEALDENYTEGEDYAKIIEELMSLVRNGIDGLPPKRKNLVLLALQEGLSDDEISARLGIAKSTIRNQRSNAIKSLKRYILLRQTN